MKKTIVFTLAALMLVSASAWANNDDNGLSCPEKPAGGEKARKMAGSYFAEAEQSFDNGLYLKALESFLCSMSMIEHENTVINIKKTLGKLPDKKAAVDRLRTYVDQHPKGELTPEIAGLADDIESSLPKEKTETCVCPPPPPAPVCPPAEKDCTAEMRGIERAHKILSLTGWLNVSIGAAAFVSAIVLQGIAGAQKNKARNATNYEAFLDAKDKNKSLQIAATSMFVASALVAGTGLVHLLLLHEEQKKLAQRAETPKDSKTNDVKGTESKPQVSLIPGPTWFGIEGTF